MVFSHLPNIGDKRYEKKFSIENMNKYEVENIIKHHPFIFVKSYPKRQVNNIYFDSINFESYFANHIGLSQRTKVRIRWYGDFFGLIKKPVLELKIRDHGVGSKIYFPLKSFRINEDFSVDLLHNDIFINSNLPDWLVDKLKYLKPLLFNHYKRDYFVSVCKRFRVTLDDDMVFIKPHPIKNFFLDIYKEDFLVVELKYLPEHDNGARHVTEHFPFRLTRNSKYVSGFNLFFSWLPN